MLTPNQSRVPRIVAASLGAILCSALMGCDWHGVVKQNTVIGWGGRTMAVAVDPTDDNFVLAVSPTGGLFESGVGGSAWGHVDALPEFGCFDVKFSPDFSNIIIVTTIEDTKIANGGGIWRSIDHGKTWSQPPTSIRKSADGSVQPHSGFGISFVRGTNQVFVGTDAGLAASNDLGATWTFIDIQAAPANPAIYSVLGLANGRVITFGTAGIWMSDNGADHWYQDNNATPYLSAPISNALAVSPLNPNDVFETDDFSTLLHSSDGGHNWTTAATGPPPPVLRQPTLKIIGEPGSRSHFDIYWAQASGVNVQRVHQNSNGLDFSAPWTPLSIAHTDPTDVAFSMTQKALYTSNDGGIEKSPDGGMTWNKVGVASSAYDALQVYDMKVVLSPQNLTMNDVYFGTQDNNLYASNDNGQTWPAFAVPEGGRFQGPVAKTGSAYTQVHFVDQGPQYYGPVFTNTKYIPVPFPQTNDLKDPPYYVRDNSFFLFQETPNGTVIWLSTDGAVTWKLIPGLNIQQTIGFYAIVSGPASNPSLIIPFSALGSSGLLRIDNAFNGIDQDEVTTSIPLPSGATLGIYGFQWLPDIASFGVDPADPNFIILPDVANNHIDITTDGGTTWTQRDDLLALITNNGAFKFSMAHSIRADFELSDAQVSVITFDPSNSNHILIGTAEAGIFYSSDHGATWSAIAGSQQVPNITSFAFIQAEAPQEAYVSSWGRGLWTISLDIAPRKEPPAPNHSSRPNQPARQAQTIYGNREEARNKLLDASSPRLTIHNVGRSLLRGVVAGGEPIALDGRNWMAGVGIAAGMQIRLDGRNLNLAMRIDPSGKFTIPLPGILVPGRHHIIVTQDVRSRPQARVELDFSIVSVDPHSEGMKR
jgi:photosystem II stability/assembly factor-like uncharacterized protein